MNTFLKNADFRRFSLASFLSSVGDILFYLTFMNYASKLQNYSLALSLIAISESVPKLLEIFGGYLADRTRKKFKNIFLAALIRFALYGLVGFLFISKIAQWHLVIIIVLINFLSDTIGSYAGGLVTPLIVDIVCKKDFGEATGFNSGVNQIINMSAQFIGSALLLVMSYANLAFVNAVTFLLAGFLFASVGLKHKKEKKPLGTQAVNQQKFAATMKSSFKQVKKQAGLLTTVLVIALLNGSLDALTPLTTIVLAAHRSAMLISTYSFTIALFSAVTGAGFAAGSMFGPQLFKKASVFLVVTASNVLSVLTTLSILLQNTYLILGLMFFLAAVAGLGSIKLEQWLVTSVDHQILASTIGLLNTILMAVAPLMTTILTTISGSLGVTMALGVLLTIEVITLIIAVTISFKLKKSGRVASVQ